MQQESKSSILFRHWLRANPQVTCSHEMKDSRGKKYLNFSEVSQAQIDYALAIKHSEKGVWIRVQAVQEGMPDYIYMRQEPAYIVIKYPETIQIIDIDDFVKEKERQISRSLSEDRATEIASTTIRY